MTVSETEHQQQSEPDESETLPDPEKDESGSGESRDDTDRIRSMERALRKANKEAESYRLKVREFEDRDKTEQQRAEEAAAQALTRAETAERELVRMRVAVAKGLPAELAERLRGNTEDELSADADSLLEMVKPTTTRVPQGQRQQGTQEPNDMSALIRRAAGRSA